MPDEEEIANCAPWLAREIQLLRPTLIVPVGKLAIAQFIRAEKLTEVIGRRIPLERDGASFDLVALPHPSGASTWHRMEPGRTLLRRALGLLAEDPAVRAIAEKNRAAAAPAG